MGAIFDTATRGVRFIYGSPGVAIIGGRMDLGNDFALGAISSRRNYLIGTVANETASVVMSLASGQTLLTLDAAASMVALSRDESVAAVYSGSNRILRVLAGLPDNPRLVRLAEVPGFADVTALAVADDASITLLATTDGIVLSSDGEGLKQLATVGRATRIRLIDRAVALIVDEDRSLVSRLAIGGSLEIITNEIKSPIDVAVTDDGGKVLVVSRQNRAVSVVNLPTGALSALACDCAPTQLLHMPGVSRFLLTELTDNAVWIIDASRSESSLFFVPVPGSGVKE
jgi:hypothetical protein